MRHVIRERRKGRNLRADRKRQQNMRGLSEKWCCLLCQSFYADLRFETFLSSYIHSLDAWLTLHSCISSLCLFASQLCLCLGNEAFGFISDPLVRISIKGPSEGRTRKACVSIIRRLSTFLLCISLWAVRCFCFLLLRKGLSERSQFQLQRLQQEVLLSLCALILSKRLQGIKGMKCASATTSSSSWGSAVAPCVCVSQLCFRFLFCT